MASAIHSYDSRILPLIRNLLAEEAKKPPEEALRHFPDRYLEMVRSSDYRTFEQWTKRANERAQANPPPT